LSLIPDIAERRSAIGEEYVASTIDPTYALMARQRLQHVHAMFKSADVEIIRRVAKAYRIDYLYVGPYEQMRYPDFLSAVKSAPEDFQEVYSGNDVHIFRVLGTLPKRGALVLSNRSANASP
jgi:hypothetical protein